AHDEHVVTPGKAPHAEAGSPALARRAFDPDDVATEESDDGHGFASEMCVGKLTRGARLDGHGLLRVGIDELRPDVAGPREMHSVLAWALPEKRRGDVPDAHHLVDRDPQDALDVVADGRYAASRLTTRDHVAQCKGAGVRVGALEPIREVLRERGPRTEGVGKAGLEREDDPGGVARRDRDGARSNASQNE